MHQVTQRSKKLSRFVTQHALHLQLIASAPSRSKHLRQAILHSEGLFFRSLNQVFQNIGAIGPGGLVLGSLRLSPWLYAK